MTNYNDGKWHGWNGGECPVHPNSRVEVLRKDGSDSGYAYVFDWDLPANRVIAFRVTKALLCLKTNNFGYVVEVDSKVPATRKLDYTVGRINVQPL